MSDRDETPMGTDPDEQSGLTVDQPDGPQIPAQSPGIFAGAQPDAKVETLSVSGFLERHKPTRATAYIIEDGTIEDELDALIRLHFENTDAEGKPVEGSEQALNEVGGVDELVRRINEANARKNAATRKVVFERMPGDEYETLHAKYQASNGTVPRDKIARWANELIVACAIAPTLTMDEVRQLRHVLSKGQMRELEDTAYAVNNSGGTGAPKSLPASIFPSQQES